MNKIPSPFKRFMSTSQFPEDDDILFEAVFDLPNDGTPTPNQLVVRVSMESADAGVCEVSLISRVSRDNYLGNFTCRVSALGDVLYGFAAIKNVPLLVFK
jgi:hypothetical protein